VGLVSVGVILLGLLVIVFGARRAKGPYDRYVALREQDANIARYEAWRGGVRSNDKTGASVAMEMLRRQWQTGAAIAIAGVVMVVVGFLIR
jgi:hypothetical protein